MRRQVPGYAQPSVRILFFSQIFFICKECDKGTEGRKEGEKFRFNTSILDLMGSYTQQEKSTLKLFLNVKQ